MQRVIPFLRKAMQSSESPAVGNIRYFELKKPKKVCKKDRCCPSAKKKDIQLQNLPISKMNCADSTERLLKLPEPVFHCVDILHHQPDNIDVPAGIPAHEELSGCF